MLVGSWVMGRYQCGFVPVSGVATAVLCWSVLGMCVWGGGGGRGGAVAEWLCAGQWRSNGCLVLVRGVATGVLCWSEA